MNETNRLLKFAATACAVWMTSLFGIAWSQIVETQNPVVPIIKSNRLESTTASPRDDGHSAIRSGGATPQLDQQASAPTGFAVVELFTSEGCSSCPPADRNLAAIAAAQSGNRYVYTLSFHVDYWNSLGWEDPFSTQTATLRQRNYAKLFGSNRIYTPQMIVNGSAEFVGSDIKKSTAAIEAAVSENATTTIVISAKYANEKLSATWDTKEDDEGQVVFIALIQNEAEQKVTAGENKNRTLRHTNIVRNFQAVNLIDEETSIELETPENFLADNFHVIAFIQNRQSGKILAASETTIATE